MAKKILYDLSEVELTRIKEYLTLYNLKIDELSFPKPQTARFLEIIKKLQGSNNQGSAELRHIVTLAELTGIDKYKAGEMVDKLRLAGELVEVSSGRFKIII
jgi:hypothetical protein